MPPIGKRPLTGSDWDLYQKLEDIGKGGFGTVYKAKRKSDGKIVAIKEIVKRCDDYGERERLFMEENDNSKKFVTLIDSFYNNIGGGKKTLCLVMNYYELGSLAQLIKSKKKLTQFSAAFVMKQVALALAELHDNKVLHRDVTPGNLLIHKIDGEKIYVHLADFGLVRKVLTNQKNKLTCVGTPGFLAPQVKNHEAYSFECDIYSLGMVFYHMVTGLLPGTDGSIVTLRKAEETIRSTVSNEAADFFSRLTGKQYQITARQIPFDPYVKSWLKDRSRVSQGPSTGVNDHRRTRSASAECTKHTFIRGKCLICTLPDPNPKENNRDSAFESGDAQPQQRQRSRDRQPSQNPRRRTSSNESNYCRQRTVSANEVLPNAARSTEWPLPDFGHLAPHTLVCKRGRFILTDASQIIGEHVDSDGFVDFVMRVKILHRKQVVETFQPLKLTTKLPRENADPVAVNERNRQRFFSINELNSDDFNFYLTIVKSLDIISGRVSQCEFVNILDVHHLHAKWMYNGDFRLLYPNHRIFFLKNGSTNPKGCGELSKTPMTDIEDDYFRRALELTRAIHKTYKDILGPNYTAKMTVGKKLYTMTGDQGGSEMPSDRFDTATFATRKNTDIRRTK